MSSSTLPSPPPPTESAPRMYINDSSFNGQIHFSHARHFYIAGSSFETTNYVNNSRKFTKNLVVCIDGTANKFGAKNSNVVELYSRLVKDDTQLTYYNSGIGTYAKPSWTSLSYLKQVVYHLVDMAIAWNFERIVLSAYQWLSENYEDGDQIFLFGFLRGAYQVRVIAGMIEKVGLLHKGNNDQIPFAYELYSATVTERQTKAQATNDVHNDESLQSSSTNSEEKIDKERNAENQHEAENPEILASYFKETLSRPNVKVHFVGAWDTVSSIGFVRGPTLPETTTGMKHVTVFRHALALDERRVKFLPEYVNGGLGPDTGNESKGSDVQEVWFAGSHSDIGGGNAYNPKSDRFGPALHWMSYEALSHGLKMHPFRGKWESIQFTESLAGFWKLFEAVPFRRLTYEDQNQTTHWPHISSPRLMQPGQLIHESVFKDQKQDYLPKAQLFDGMVLWDEDDLTEKNLIEKDPYLSADTILSLLSEASSKRITKSQENILLPLTTSGLIFHATLKFPVSSVSFSPDGASLFAGTKDGLISSWKVDGTVWQKPVFENYGCVWSIVFSPDGTRIATAHEDNTVLIHDNTGKNIGEPLDHEAPVLSVVFSADGKFIVTASSNDIYTWDAVNLKRKGCSKHSGVVLAVTVSPDSCHVASASDDKIIHISDIRQLHSSNPIQYKLVGHTEAVTCIQYSPDGTRLISGSTDCTIRLWDTTTREIIATISTNSPVQCLVVSRSGHQIACGSNEGSIQVWDANTGEQSEVINCGGSSSRGYRVHPSPYHGHPLPSFLPDGPQSFADYEGSISAIVFAPDGRRLLSGSTDGEVHVWELL